MFSKKNTRFFFGYLVILVSFLVHSAIADEIDMGGYRVVSHKGAIKVFLQGQNQKSLISRILPQITFPVGGKRGWGNFSLVEHSLERRGDDAVWSGRGIFAQSVKVEDATFDLKPSVEMSFEIVFTSEGRAQLNYEFENTGDEIYAQPFVNTDLKEDLVRGKSWTVSKIQNQKQEGQWPQSGHGLRSVIWKGAGRVEELRITSADLDTSVGRVLFTLTPDTHMRLSGVGDIKLFNHETFAGIFTFNEWESMPEGKKFGIAAEIDFSAAVSKTN
jgi:hypothetical protein